jgi:hypothetical protein
MAQDSYRSSQEAPPASNSYPEPKHSQSNLYPGSGHPPSYHAESDRQRYRDASPGQRSKMESAHYQKTRQPINEAVNSAVDKADASNALPPEILSQITSQITASVLQQLKGTTLDSTSPISTLSTSNIPTAALVATNGVTRAHSIPSDNSPPLSHRDVYTPPSPHRSPEEPVFASPTSPTKFSFSAPGRHSPDDDKRPASPGSLASQAIQADESRSEKAERPKAPTRKPTEITTLEKIWGPLFEGSRPTARLGQFLKGLALHLIEDYEPKYSLVITPQKMQKYYEDTKLSQELYPWQVVFDDRTSSISRLYREVEAQHHLVQDRVEERPDIPALTPLGFERWSTLMLLAHPDQEFERLQKAVLDMPIGNFDDRKERFPKEISRRLFPKIPDQNIREKLEKGMITHCNISLLHRYSSGPDQLTPQPQPTATAHRADSMASTTSSQPSVPSNRRPETAPSAPAQDSNIERDRQPYSNTPSEGAIEDEDDIPTPQPIERERNPYSAQPGGGRTYDDIRRPSTPPDSRAPPSAAAAKLGRSASVASSSGRPVDPPRSQPIPMNAAHHLRQSTQPGAEGLSIPDAAPIPRHRANSILNHHHPSSRSMRHRSPSANTQGGSEYRRLDGDVSFGPSAYGPYSSSPSGDVIEDARRHRDYERHYPPDRHDRHDPMRQSMYEMPAREREARPRYQSNAGYGDTTRTHYNSDEDHYRSTGGRSHNGGYDGQQYYR